MLSENMTTAPTQIDGAEVIAFVILDPEVHKDSGSLRLYADGALQTSFYGLAIATYDFSGFYLFFSDIDWETENDTLHGSMCFLRSSLISKCLGTRRHADQSVRFNDETSLPTQSLRL